VSEYVTVAGVVVVAAIVRVAAHNENEHEREHEKECGNEGGDGNGTGNESESGNGNEDEMEAGAQVVAGTEVDVMEVGSNLPTYIPDDGLVHTDIHTLPSDHHTPTA
jgi:hypothetical protein